MYSGIWNLEYIWNSPFGIPLRTWNSTWTLLHEWNSMSESPSCMYIGRGIPEVEYHMEIWSSMECVAFLYTVYLWYVQERCNGGSSSGNKSVTNPLIQAIEILGTPVSGPLLTSKALQLYPRLYPEDPNPIQGRNWMIQRKAWCNNFVFAGRISVSKHE